ncbi:hypothetical protein [Roseobacter weihaiensis]|nr:hypothetical protein [Roseobacter sp. H9]
MSKQARSGLMQRHPALNRLLRDFILKRAGAAARFQVQDEGKTP